MRCKRMEKCTRERLPPHIYIYIHITTQANDLKSHFPLKFKQFLHLDSFGITIQFGELHFNKYSFVRFSALYGNHFSHSSVDSSMYNIDACASACAQLHRFHYLHNEKWKFYGNVFVNRNCFVCAFSTLWRNFPSKFTDFFRLTSNDQSKCTFCTKNLFFNSINHAISHKSTSRRTTLEHLISGSVCLLRVYIAFALAHERNNDEMGWPMAINVAETIPAETIILLMVSKVKKRSVKFLSNPDKLKHMESPNVHSNLCIQNVKQQKGESFHMFYQLVKQAHWFAWYFVY